MSGAQASVIHGLVLSSPAFITEDLCKPDMACIHLYPLPTGRGWGEGARER